MNAFATRYATCFVAYVRRPGEETLGAAYELGREAVAQGISLTQVAVAHHDALAGALADGGAPGTPAETTQAAGDFLLEVLAAFEMVQRGFREVRDAARRERQHAELLRQLSHFMTDESLSSAGSQALDEVLRLVAEQARELTRADTALVTLCPEPQAHARAACHPEEDARWDAFARWVDLTPIDARVRSAGGEPVHLDAEGIATSLVSGPSPSDLDLNAWLGVGLRSLSGAMLGGLHLIAQESRFPAGDAAVAVQLAEMSAAAVERADIHAVRGPVG